AIAALEHLYLSRHDTPNLACHLDAGQVDSAIGSLPDICDRKLVVSVERVILSRTPVESVDLARNAKAVSVLDQPDTRAAGRNPYAGNFAEGGHGIRFPCGSAVVRAQHIAQVRTLAAVDGRFRIHPIGKFGRKTVRRPIPSADNAILRG